MSADARSASLSHRHEQLDRLLAVEAQRPKPDDAVLQRLKCEKLRIKDEIRRLSPN